MTTTARGFRFTITSRTCVNQLNTSGRSSPLAMRPSIASIASNHERVAGDPDPQLLTRRELHALRRLGGAGDGRRPRRLRSDDLRVDLVVAGAAERRLQRAAGAVEEERRADALERPRHGQRDVALPALRLDRRRLVQAGSVQQERNQERGQGDDDRRAGRVEAPPALRGASPGPPPASLSSLHQNWK
jgi:hypothetical protein